jgi:hypothetical protein
MSATRLNVEVSYTRALRLCGDLTAFGVGETNTPSTQALLQHAILLAQIFDHAELMLVPHPPSMISRRRTSGGIECIVAEYIGSPPMAPHCALRHALAVSSEYMDIAGMSVPSNRHPSTAHRS